MNYHPCKHLDYTEGKFGPDIELMEIGPAYPGVKYWHRGQRWTDNGPGETPNPANVQFCGKNGMRINDVFYCYAPGCMHCYDPE